MIVLYIHHTRQAEHALPYTIYRFRHPKPCDGNPVSVRIRHGLRCIEVTAAVQKLPVLRKFHCAGFFIKLRQHTDRPIRITVGVLDQFHRGEYKDAASVYVKEIRALPHPAELLFRRRLSGQTPVGKILTLIE